jgi:hypothetical protein
VGFAVPEAAGRFVALEWRFTMKYRVVVLPNGLYTQVLSEEEWDALPPSEQAGYKVVKTDLPTLAAAQQFNQSMGGQGGWACDLASPESCGFGRDSRP